MERWDYIPYPLICVESASPKIGLFQILKCKGDLKKIGWFRQVMPIYIFLCLPMNTKVWQKFHSHTLVVPKILVSRPISFIEKADDIPLITLEKRSSYWNSFTIWAWNLSDNKTPFMKHLWLRSGIGIIQKCMKVY